MSREAPAPERPTLRKRGRITVFLTVLLDLLGFGMILPILPFYGQDYGASDLQIGFLFAAYSLAQLLFSPLLGKLSDRWGRRPVLLATIAVAAVAHVGFAFAPTFLLLVAARFTSGVATANLGVAMAYMADVTKPAERSKAMGMIGAAFGLGFILGPAFGGVLSLAGRTAVPLGAAALAGVNLVMAWAFLPESLDIAVREGRRGERWLDLSRAGRVLGSPALLGMMLLILLVTTAFAMMEATLALFAQDRFGWGDREMSATFVYIGVVAVIVQGGLIGPLVRRFGEDRLVPAGILCLAAGLLLLPVSPGPLTFAATAGLLALGMGLNNPSLMGLLSRLADDTSQGSVLGLSRSFGSLARVVGPVAGTWLFQRVGPESPFQSAGVLMVLALVGAFFVIHRARQQLARDELAGGPGLGGRGAPAATGAPAFDGSEGKDPSEAVAGSTVVQAGRPVGAPAAGGPGPVSEGRFDPPPEEGFGAPDRGTAES